MSIYVKLIAATPDADKIVASAAKLCYSPSGAAEILNGLDGAKVASFLGKLRESGHLSPFEHVGCPSPYAHKEQWANFRGWRQYRKLVEAGMSV